MTGARATFWAFLPAVLALVLAWGSAAGAASPPLHSSVDRATISTELGQTFETRTSIANTGTSGVVGAIAHLNILSLHDGTYVDPEDWSSRRTRYLPAVPPGGSTTIGWRLHAVSPGSFVVYVALVRADGAALLSVSPPVRVTVSDRTTLNAGGIVPLAVGMPLLLGLVWLIVRIRRASSVGRHADGPPDGWA